jgi:hypothetical protein
MIKIVYKKSSSSSDLLSSSPTSVLEERAVRGHFKFEPVFIDTSQNVGELINSPDYGDISRVFSQFKGVSQLTGNTPKHQEIMW